MTSKGDGTRERIIAAGLAIAADTRRASPGTGGLHCVGFRSVARALGMRHGNVRYYFANVQALQDAVAAQAVADGVATVVVELITKGHPAVRELSRPERVRYLLDQN